MSVKVAKIQGPVYVSFNDDEDFPIEEKSNIGPFSSVFVIGNQLFATLSNDTKEQVLLAILDVESNYWVKDNTYYASFSVSQFVNWVDVK